MQCFNVLNLVMEIVSISLTWLVNYVLKINDYILICLDITYILKSLFIQ